MRIRTATTDSREGGTIPAPLVTRTPLSPRRAALAGPSRALAASLAGALVAAGALAIAPAASGAELPLQTLPNVTTGPFSWTEPSDGGSGITEVTASGLASAGSLQAQGFCVDLPVAQVSLGATTSWSNASAPAVYENPRAGATVRIVADTPDGTTTAWSWTTPPEDVAIVTRDDLAPHVASVGLAPAPGSGGIARWGSEVYAETQDGSFSEAPPPGTARAYVQADPTDPAPLSQPGTPATWHLSASVELPATTTGVRMVVDRLDGVTETLTSAVPVLEDCGLQLQDQAITVPVGQSAQADLLAGANVAPEKVGTEQFEASADLAVAPMSLGLRQEGTVVVATPTEAGTVSIPVTGTARGTARTLTGTATLTVTAVDTAAPIVDILDQTVELTVGQAGTIDLLAGASASVPLDDLNVFATTAEASDLRDGTGWARTGRSVSVLPTRPGTWTVQVEAYTADYAAWDTATLSLVVTEVPTPEPTPVVPEPTPVVPEPSPVPAPAPSPAGQVAPPVVTIETDLPLAGQATVSTLGVPAGALTVWVLGWVLIVVGALSGFAALWGRGPAAAAARWIIARARRGTDA